MWGPLSFFVRSKHKCLSIIPNDSIFWSNYVNENGIFVMAAEKKVDNLDFSKYLWNNITIKCPSPRDPSFIDSMRYARECIKSNSLKVSDMWEMGYDRDDAKKAFENKVNGIDKGRTYLKWN